MNTITITTNTQQNIYLATFSDTGDTYPTPYFLTMPLNEVKAKIQALNPNTKVI